MRRAVIVIGANYGDEGKGLAAYLAAETLEASGPCLNVLINGGPQRGHTVERPDGRRHVYHHFGSGSAAGAVSLCDRDFLVNPAVFMREAEEMRAEMPGANTRCLVSADCRVTLPYDMMLNQILEDARGAARHGSCGMGVYETRLRYETVPDAPRYGAMTALGRDDFGALCRRIAGEYIPERLAREGLRVPEGWRELLAGEGLAEHCWRDLRAMADRAETYGDWPRAAEGFDSLVFEAGQGLALDEFNTADSPHLTPSRTTSRVSAERAAALGDCRADVVYVTRSYLTRHGAGPLPTECPREAVSPSIVDRTNVPNPYQQTLRYGRFDGAAVRRRVFADLADTRRVLPEARATALVTHLNETGGRLFGDMPLAAFADGFDRLVRSDSPFGADQPLAG